MHVILVMHILALRQRNLICALLMPRFDKRFPEASNLSSSTLLCCKVAHVLCLALSISLCLFSPTLSLYLPPTSFSVLLSFPFLHCFLLSCCLLLSFSMTSLFVSTLPLTDVHGPQMLPRDELLFQRLSQLFALQKERTLFSRLAYAVHHHPVCVLIAI